MKRRALLQFALAAGCARAPERQVDAAALLHVGCTFGEFGADTEAWARRELARLHGLFRERRSRPHDLGLGQALSDVLFGAAGFVREVHDSSLDFVLLPSVLRRRRGNCVGLGTLLLAFAEAVGTEAHGILRPGHFYVCVRDRGRLRNVELLREGEELPDSWYEQRFPVLGSASAGYYARALTPREVLGVIEYNIGKARMTERRWSDARRAFLGATTHFPDFAEAHASLGSVLHVEGTLDAAERAYRRALERNPTLPGVEWNLEILRAERAIPG